MTVRKIFTRRAEPIRIISDSDNKLSDKWTSTVAVVLSNTFLFVKEGRPNSDSEFEKLKRFGRVTSKTIKTPVSLSGIAHELGANMLFFLLFPSYAALHISFFLMYTVIFRTLPPSPHCFVSLAQIL